MCIDHIAENLATGNKIKKLTNTIKKKTEIRLTVTASKITYCFF